MVYTEVPKSVATLMETITEKCGEAHQDWAKNFQAASANTLLTTVKRQEDGTTFLLAGDTLTMWLRDSIAQVRPCLVIAREGGDLAQVIAGLVKRRFRYIRIDPYANTSNETDNHAGHQTDRTEMDDWIWERKYEIDPSCYLVQLACLLYKNTGMTEQFNSDLVEGIKKILGVFTTEQGRAQLSYLFERDMWCQEDMSVKAGKGTPVGKTGMTWSGFCPSDDACQYGYLVPSNMFAVVILGYIQETFSSVLEDATIGVIAKKLQEEIEESIQTSGRTKNKDNKMIYAYEVNGLGNVSMMDDNNIPNLVAAPYLGYCSTEDEQYLTTRQILLNKEDPYFYEGKYAKGIGSSHTPENYVQPIALVMEGMTTKDKAEKERTSDLLVAIDAGVYLMHEGFDADNPENYTREWFSRANMMFCELIMDYSDIRMEK